MPRPDLVPDCASCAALCCVATTFDASEDFAFAKPAGTRCRKLRANDRCTIHAELRERGFSGCAVYDCYGAGPRVTRAFARIAGSERERERNEAFLMLRVVHELLWLLTEACKLCPPAQAELAAELAREIDALDAFATQSACALTERALARHELSARGLLRRVGAALGGRRRLTVLRAPTHSAQPAAASSETKSMPCN
jgi:hypothetical protein